MSLIKWSYLYYSVNESIMRLVKKKSLEKSCQMVHISKHFSSDATPLSSIAISQTY